METWLAQYFINSTFVAGGAALVASPIIVHLINRMRFRRVRFAAMEFLLQSEQRNRRRVLFEQLLLLLLRILIVLGLVALLARLVLDPAHLSMFRGATAHHVVLLDDSGSMRDRHGDATAFERGREVVQKLVAEGSRRRRAQRLSLLLASHPDEPMFVQRVVNEDLVSELETKLENLRCTHQAVDLVKGLDAAKRLLLTDQATIKHVHVISDFRLRDWQDQNAIAAAVRELDAGSVTLNLVKLVEERSVNLAVTKLGGELQVAAAGVPVRLKVAVKNFSDAAAKDVALDVIQDGQKLPLSLHFDKVEAGQEIEREFDISFDSPQKHDVQVTLAADALLEDNSRYLAIDVSNVNKVLLIDGNPAGQEALYLADALAADPGVTGYAPQIESIDYLRRRPLDEFQSVFVLNVGDVPPDALDPLETYVAAGGGLAWFVGDAVKPAFYKDALFKEGRGLFPVPLAAAPRDLPADLSDNPQPDLVLTSSPIFRIFEGQQNPYIEVSRVFKFLPVDDDWVRDDQARKDGVTTIANLRNREPFMFAHRFGKGTVVTCLTTCGPTWNNWASYASFVILQLELQKFIARTDRTLEQRIVGQPIHVSLDPSEFAETVKVTVPELAGEPITFKAAPVTDRLDSPQPDSTDRDAKETPPAVKSPASPEALRLAASFRDTDEPGVYTLQLLDHNQVPSERWFAYNFPMEEGDLELATTQQIRKQLGDDVRVEIQEPGSVAWIEGEEAGHEMRRALLVLLVVCLVCEQFLAYRFSYHPQRARSRSKARESSASSSPTGAASVRSA